MVKLVFNPSDKNTNFVESKSSKKREVNLNPFSSNFENELLPLKNDNICQELNLKDIVGLENCSYVLNEWYTKEKSKMLLIIGPVGCGKTSLVEIYCKENSIQLYNVRQSETIKTKKELLRDLICFIQYSSTSFFIKNSSTTKKLILIDEYQNGQLDLLSISDINNLFLFKNDKLKEENKKELSTFFNDINLDFILPPILIISADSKGSKLSELKKIHTVFYINEIPDNLMRTLNTFDIPENILTEIIRKCKSDKRLFLNTLNFLKLNKNNDFTEFIDSFYKDIDVNIFEFIHLLFDNLEPINLDDIFKTYDTDGFLLSNLVFENYLDYNQDINSVANSAEAISIGETIFSDTFESSKSFIPDAHCINSLCIPSYYSRTDKPNKNIRSCCINNRYNIYLNNKKIISKINNGNVNYFDITDIYFIKKFLNQDLIKNKIHNFHQENYIKNILGSLKNIKEDKSLEKLELIYKHFSEFNEKDLKTKNFTLKFKEKLKKLN